MQAIDIRSNAARLLINEVKNLKRKARICKTESSENSFQIGNRRFTTGEIGKERKEMVIKSMKVFSQLMEIYGVEHYRACATSAMRDAKNGKEIIDLVKRNQEYRLKLFLAMKKLRLSTKIT